jgi:aryl-alcohol dehydrogenase-like predicted oxidoreductase
MRKVRLGKTDLEVSAVALGTWSYGGDWGSFDEEDAKATIRRAVELGITLFDTAQGYGFGVAERVLADGLWKVVRRDQVHVATKGGLRMEGNTLVRDASGKWLRSGLESSLRNLSTDYVDLYQVHWPDLHTPAQETAQVLADLVSEGKIRHIGVSNYTPAQIDELSGYGPVETVQPPYHMFHRDIEDDLLPYTTMHDIGVLVYGPLAHGLLAGRMDPQTRFPADDWRSHSPDFTGDNFARNLQVVERLRAFGQARGIPLPQVAVGWTITNSAVDVAIVGARRPAHLDDLTPAADLSLSPKDRQEIEHILADAVRIVGPSPEGM